MKEFVEEISNELGARTKIWKRLEIDLFGEKINKKLTRGSCFGENFNIIT